MRMFRYKIDSKWGYITHDQRGITGLGLPFWSKAELDEAAPAAQAINPSDTLTNQLVRRIEDYLHGQRVSFLDFPLSQGPWSPFRQAVYHHLRQVGYGETISYGQLARSVGRPHSARAVGRAMATNPLPLLIPCHRVLSSNAQLTGFSAPGGIESKKFLLDLEQGR